MEYSQNEMLRQIFDNHWQEFCDYWAARTKDASQVETVGFNSDRMTGVLMTFNWQGVKKVVSVKPEDLLQALSQLNEELRQRCIDGAEKAERAAAYANSQGDYAKSQGDRIDALIAEITDLKARVKAQGDTAEAQGNAAQAQKELVEAWYSPFKSNVESWYSGIVSDISTWYAVTKEDWNTWFAARKQQWTDWFNSITSDWSTWYAVTKEDWDTWFAARKQQWNEWFAAKGTEWSEWFAAKKLEWSEWFTSARNIVESWATKERERQTAEEIRQEIMAHPPIPSERGYWMFWSLETTPHSYVETGYSSRGTMDWPEFFWDYSCMGIGVVTTRDYSRFFIDEQGRYGMLM